MRAFCVREQASFIRNLWVARSLPYKILMYLLTHTFVLVAAAVVFVHLFFFLLLFHTKICFKFKHRIMHRKPRNAYFCLWIHFMWNLHCCASRVCVYLRKILSKFSISFCVMVDSNSHNWERMGGKKDAGDKIYSVFDFISLSVVTRGDTSTRIFAFIATIVAASR